MSPEARMGKERDTQEPRQVYEETQKTFWCFLIQKN